MIAGMRPTTPSCTGYFVGDVDPATHRSQKSVCCLFGPIPFKKLPERPSITLRPMKATSITVETDRPQATEILAVRMPGLESADFPAAELLSDILNNHRFALYDLVVRGEASNVQFGLDSLSKAGLGYVAVTFPVAADSGATRVKIQSVLRRLVQTGVSQDLLDAAKQAERRQTEVQKNSIEELASIWSDAVALYGLPSPDADLVRLEKVTVADVNRVIRKYLDIDHAVSASLVPATSGKAVAKLRRALAAKENCCPG